MKKIAKSNFRVEVYPRTTAYGIHIDDEENVCEQILPEIRRHINDVHSAYIIYDENPVCSNCGSAWSEDGDAYNGGCCATDQIAEDTRVNNATGWNGIK